MRFRYVPAGEISAIGAVEGGRLGPYRAANGETVALAAPGQLSARALIAQATPGPLDIWWRRLPAILMILLGTIGASAFFLLTRRREERA